MKLVEIYALQMGLKIGRPYIRQDFFPVPFDNYIVIHASCGEGDSRSYDHWQIVLDLIKPILEDEKIRIIQVGGEGEKTLKGVVNYCGATVNQTAYIISKAKLLMGNDSCFVHMAGGLDVPVIGLYGATHPNITGPYWKTVNSVLIESHRKGNKPSYSNKESEKTINFIKPEEVAKAVFNILKIDVEMSHTSYHIGKIFNIRLVEVVPNMVLPKNMFPNDLVNVRMDYHFDENKLFQMGSIRKVSIVTDKAINLKVLNAIKKNIKSLNYEINLEADINYLLSLKKSGFKPMFFIRNQDEEEISKIRLKFFDLGKIEIIDQKNKDFLDFSPETTDNLLYRSNKHIFSNGKVYLSKADWLQDRPITSENQGMPIIDSEDFYQELDYFYIFSP